MARTIAKDYNDKRALILSRAAKLFADDGFDRASVSKVAEACEISKANIYHYYKGKDEILFDILDRYLSSLRDRICGLDVEGAAPDAALHLTVREILLAYQGADDEHRLQSNAINFLSEERRIVLVGYQRELVAYMNQRIEAIAPDVFADDPEKLRAATMSVFGMLNWFYMWNRSGDQAARESYAEIVCKICLRGLPGL